jgi:hypothetical protein
VFKGGADLMNIRFTDGNWNRFFTHNKDTTWRTKQRKDGVYERIKGSLYKPIKTGELLEMKYLKCKPFAALDEADARHDGFSTLQEFIEELTRLNPKMLPTTMLYCHEVKYLGKETKTVSPE